MTVRLIARRVFPLNCFKSDALRGYNLFNNQIELIKCFSVQNKDRATNKLY